MGRTVRPETSVSEYNDIETDLDEDMEKLLATLRDIPVAEIPPEFQNRLSLALKEEGKRIREEKSKGAWNVRRWNIKAIAAVAVCFVVVFASVAVYNNGIGGSSMYDSMEGSPEMASMNRSGSGSGSGSEDEAEYEENIENGTFDAGADTDVQLANDAAPAMRNPSEKYGALGKSDDLSKQDESIYVQSAAPDTLCREGGKYPEAANGYLNYRKLIDEYLEGYEFEYTSCERDPVTGEHLFTVLIISDPEGREIDSPMFFIGVQGEIHEQQQEEQDAGGD